MMQVVLQLLYQNHLVHLQIHLLQPQDGGALILPPMKGLAPFRSRAGGACVGEVVTPGGAHVGATGITSCTCLPECMSGD
jgi:hypothetical protein